MVDVVSFLIPVYNEERYIDRCLASIAGQDAVSDSLEVVIADGGSTDATLDEIEAFRRANPSLRVVLLKNPSRNTATGRNICLASASGSLVLNFSGHAVADSGLVRVLREKLLSQPETVAAVGAGIRSSGVDSFLGRAISSVLSSPLSGGNSIDSGFNAERDQFARSIAFALYRKAVVEKVGGFDESLWCGQDAELNYRLSRSGCSILYTPESAVGHFKRSSISGLLRQMYRYGIARARILRMYPDSFRVIHLLPAVACALVPVAVAASWFSSVVYWGSMAAFFSFLGGSVIATRSVGGQWTEAAISPFLYGIIYIGYGTGFLFEFLRTPSGDVDAVTR